MEQWLASGTYMVIIIPWLKGYRASLEHPGSSAIFVGLGESPEAAIAALRGRIEADEQFTPPLGTMAKR